MMNIQQHKNRTLFGCVLQQSYASMYVLEKMLDKYKPQFIAELGVGSGVLSKYFLMYCQLNNAKYIGVDLQEPKYNQFLNDNNFILGNTRDDKVMDRIIDNAHKVKRAFILIDDDDPKSKSVNHYAPILKRGTVVFAHDSILNGNERFHWGFTEDKIDYTFYERYEPYYSLSRKYDTRMLSLRRI